MTDIKYTNDGKKVLIVGKLNSQETIVQEIFVSAGQEIPSGENFVVKSLHDAPAESWKEKNLRELEARYESDRKKLQTQIDDQERRLSLERDKAKLQTSALLQFVKNSDESQLETLKNFMSGQITHLFVAGYSPEIISWKDSDKVYDADSFYHHARLDGIKLVSLMGKSDGDLSYRLHEYRDGSGGCGKTIYPTTSYEAALAMAQAQLDEDGNAYVSGGSQYLNVETWRKIDGIVIPPAVIERWEMLADAQRLDRIEKLRKELTDLESKAPVKRKK
jgi:hypothetical protein